MVIGALPAPRLRRMFFKCARHKEAAHPSGHPGWRGRTTMNTISPKALPPKAFTDPASACDYVAEIYDRNTGFIREHLYNLSRGIVPPGKVRAFYPQAQVTSTSYGKTDSTLPYGFLHTPGIYRTTLTAPALFRNYLL